MELSELMRMIIIFVTFGLNKRTIVFKHKIGQGPCKWGMLKMFS